jgi:hypothetical protein
MTTLLRVTGQREWTGKYGPNVSIGLLCSDTVGEFAAELTCKPESLMTRLEMLEDVIGKDREEWAFQNMGTWDDGKPKPRKVTFYPGKQAPSAHTVTSGPDRSHGGISAAWRNTEAGAKYEDERVDRREALRQAVTDGHDNVLGLATAFYQWLRESVSAPKGEPAGAPHHQNPPGAETPSDEGGEQSNSPTHREAASPSPTTPLIPDPEGTQLVQGVCRHEWVDAPRKGWKVCAKCRRAIPEGEAK